MTRGFTRTGTENLTMGMEEAGKLWEEKKSAIEDLESRKTNSGL